MATRTWRGTTSTAYALNGNWAEGAIPTVSDDVVFDATFTNPCTISDARSVKSITLTNHTGTITVNNTWTCTGAFTGYSGATLSGSGGLLFNETATLTQNSTTISCRIQTGGSAKTFTLGDNWSISGLVSLSASGQTISGNSITTSGGLLIGNTCIGTTSLIITGGTIKASATSGSVLKLPLSIAGNVTFGDVLNNYFCYEGNTFTYTSGTVSYYNTSTIFYVSVATTWNTGSGMANIPELRCAGTQTLNADLYVDKFTVTGTGTFAGTGAIRSGATDWEVTDFGAIITGTTTWTLTNDINCTNVNYTMTSGSFSINSKNIYFTGNLTTSGQTSSIGGNTIHYAIGTGLISGSAPTNFTIPSSLANLTINTLGTITFGSHFSIYNNFTYMSGIVDTASNNSTIWVTSPFGATSTLNSNGITLNRVNFLPITTTGLTTTLSSNLQATTLNFFNFKTTFSGNYDITCTNLMMFPQTNSNPEIVLVSDRTLTVNTLMSIFGTSNYYAKISATTPLTHAHLIFNGNRNQNICYCDMTDIDASGGNTVYVGGGTLTRTTNVVPLDNSNLIPYTNSKTSI